MKKGVLLIIITGDCDRTVTEIFQLCNTVRGPASPGAGNKTRMVMQTCITRHFSPLFSTFMVQMCSSAGGNLPLLAGYDKMGA
jgi:hypothetical protein